MQVDDDESFPKKPDNPRYKSNFLSMVTFWWVIKVFRLGNKRDYTESDLTRPLEEHSSKILGNKLTKRWLQEQERAKNKGVQPSLNRVLCKQFSGSLAVYAFVITVMEFGVRLFQPFFVGLLVRYFVQQEDKYIELEGDAVNATYVKRIFYFWTPHTTYIEKNEAYFYASGLVVTCLLCQLILHPYMFAVQHIDMKMRIASCSLMYRKALLLELCSVEGGGTVGQVINLMSNDVSRFDLLPHFIQYIWISTLQYFIILYFLYRELHSSAFIGAIAILVCLPIQGLLGYEIARLRAKTAARTDTRVRQMNEIICGIQVIKMYGWENTISIFRKYN